MRFLDVTYIDVHLNLALDEALLQRVEDEGEGTILRVWDPPDWAVVLGASGRLNEDVDRAACDRDGLTLARRSSGGGTVVIGPGVLNFAIVLAVDGHPAYRSVDAAQREVLARCADAWNAIRPPGHPPIEVRGSGDLTINGRKCSGSAQRRLRRHFLVHATLLRDFPLARISTYLKEPRRQPEHRLGRTHDDFVSNLALPRATLVEGLRSAWSADEVETEPSASALKSALRIVDTKLARPDWIERL